MDNLIGTVDGLVEFADYYRGLIRQGPFFQHIAETKTRDDLGWIGQLPHQSREFTQALCLRYSMCNDRALQSVFAEHAFEEADHPDKLAAWMRLHDLFPDARPLSETLHCTAFSWRSAVYDPPDMQIVALNLVSEGVALDFYTAVIPMLERLGMLSGRYWTVHREVDATHLQMGLHLLNSAYYPAYQHQVHVTANLYHRMLSAWVSKYPSGDICRA